MAFQLWYTNYFIDFKSDQTTDPKNISGIETIGDVSANGDFSAWHVKSQLAENDFKRHLKDLLADQTTIDPDTITITKGINGGPLSML
ncbi:hypothetical protein [Companilactobacillus sp. FL22-1]|uniref:hypothetical protein n=1 Tax=Companilactobacillus sp. FL22-1 TaxID=3373892 RepID=UPI003754CD15